MYNLGFLVYWSGWDGGAFINTGHNGFGPFTVVLLALLSKAAYN